MEIEKFIEKDRGIVIRFISDVMVKIASVTLEIFLPYATKYRYVWEGKDPFEYLSIPHNQMTIGDIDE